MKSATLQFYGSYADGWRSNIPREFATFQDRSIGIWIESAEDGSGPDPALAHLLDHILGNLPALLETASSELARYEDDSEGAYLFHIFNPHIWLTVDLVPDDPSAWSFIVERDDWPNFGWHIEFRGIRFHEIWAGD